jgi:homoserine O-succinyltransferase
MSLILPDDHPAFHALKKEGYDLVPQGGNPLRIAVLNLMPDKEATELELMRMLGACGFHLDITWLTTASYLPRNADPKHLRKFYRIFPEVEKQNFDGMIITGAPVEHLDFEQVSYWEEMTGILDWAVRKVRSTLYICWAAQAALYHHYGIDKVPLRNKLSGVFKHQVFKQGHPLLQGVDHSIDVPQSRYTGLPDEVIQQHPDLHVLVGSQQCGIHLLDAPAIHGICMTGHPEYGSQTLANEYERDIRKGIDAKIPENYFADDDPTKDPVYSWKKDALKFYSNWLNHYVAEGSR